MMETINKERKVKISVAIGYAQLDEDANETVEELVVRADVLMYANKCEIKKNSNKHNILTV